jgi:AraC-like DNA-binding protein
LAPHVNVATTIAVSLAEDFSLRTWRRSKSWTEWRSCAVAVIPSETLHHLVSTGPMAFLYLDPLGDGRFPMGQDQLEQGRRRLIHEANAIGLHAAFAAFGLATTQPRDARIAKVVLEIERRPHEFRRLQDAAALACLSPSRFRARFAKEVGLPFRRYRLWRRIASVMRGVAQGGNLTESAHLAGFSSSAHLSFAFKQMFGLAASDILAMGVAIDVADEAVQWRETAKGPGPRDRQQAGDLEPSI